MSELPSTMSQRLRGFGPLGILAIAAIVSGNFILPPLSAVLVLVWTRWSQTPWREIGYVRPVSWLGGLAIGLALGIALKLVLKAVIMPLLGADPINQAYHFLTGNTAVALPFAFELIVVAGFGEETFFRGYLFERLSKLLGEGRIAKTAAVLLTSAYFGSLHYFDQGIAGAQQATIVGLIFGTIFAITGRLWMLMVAHSALDLTALALIYWNLESDVAHWVFK